MGIAGSLRASAKRVYQRLHFFGQADLLLRHRWQAKHAQADYQERLFQPLPDASSIRSVLIFKPDEIGDAVYALPAIAELRRTLPQARLFLICQSLAAPIYRASGLLDEIAAAKVRNPDGPFCFMSVSRTLDALSLRSFDLGIYLKPSPRYFRQFLRVPCRDRVYPCDARFPARSIYRPRVEHWGPVRAHAAVQLLQIVSGVSGRTYGHDQIVFPPLEWAPEDRARAATVFPDGAVPERFGVIHPFVKDQTRRYPIAMWVQLIRRLQQEFSFPWLVVGGPGDPQLELPAEVIQAQGRLSLGSTGYLLSRASAFVGLLSGPAHLAAASGIPSVTLFSGVSPVAEWAPLGRSLILRSDVPCAPCESKTCPVFDVACMRELTPQRILPELIDFLQREIPIEPAACGSDPVNVPCASKR
jgi:ADP-heptose:LPS heptosyltransferase